MQSSAWLDASAVAAFKLAVSFAVASTGFRALSDDDFARIVIAQRFAESPALDPSGTSWLPLPFWIYGTTFAAFGNDLEVARALAFLLGALGAVGVWLAARLVGLGRGSALGAGFVAAVFPYSAYLGAAAVPEAPTAALVVLGAATLALGAPLRILGALALGAAAASRYETWPAAFVFGITTGCDAFRTRDRRLWAASGIALSFPLAWLLHGVVRHDDALFFLRRVASYRAALGPDAPFFERLLRTPRAFFSAEPELALAAAVLAGFVARAATWAGRSRDDDAQTQRSPSLDDEPVRAVQHDALVRGSICVAVLVFFLLLGDLLGGAPTHHEARSLLAAWFWCAILLAHFAERIRTFGVRLRVLAVFAISVTTLVGSALIRPRIPHEGFASREAEIDLGTRARKRQIGRLAIDTTDFGYFAIQAAFGRPEATLVLDDRDPRKSRSVDALAEAPRALAERLAGIGIRWLAVPNPRAALARRIAVERERNERWTLLELR